MWKTQPWTRVLIKDWCPRLICLSHTRPNIDYAVSVVSQFMHNSKEPHLRVVYQIIQYLKGTSGKGILFKKRELNLEAYTNALSRSIDK